MKKIKIRILSLLLALITAAGVSCGKVKPGQTDTDGTTAGDTTAESTAV